MDTSLVCWVISPRRSRRLVSISVETRGGEGQQGDMSCDLYTLPPVHSTTEFFPFTPGHSSVFLFCPYSSVSTAGRWLWKTWIWTLSKCQTPSGRLVFLSVRKTGWPNLGSAGRGGMTSFQMSRGGGTRCLFLKTNRPIRNHKSPPPQHLSKPTSQSGLKRHTDAHTHTVVVSVSQFILESLFLHLDALICSYLTIKQPWERRRERESRELI